MIRKIIASKWRSVSMSISRPHCTKFTTAAIITLASLSCPWTCAAFDDVTRVLEEFDVACGGDIIIVPVSVADKSYSFVLDTGCTFSCFSTRHKHTLGGPLRKVPGVVPGGENTMEQFAAPRMALGAIPLRSDPEVGCIDLSFLERYAGRDVDGLLGMDALRQLVLNIDFDAGKVRILSSAQDQVGRPVPIIWHQRRHMREGPFLEALIDGDLPIEFLVDSGAIRAHFGSLDPEPFDVLQSNGVIAPLQGQFAASSLGGATTVRFGRLSRVSIANHEHKDVIVERLRFWNTVGIGFLVRYVATFDFPASKAYLIPSRSFGSPEPVGLSGLSFDRKNGAVVITRVRKKSPGDAAGIAAGDVLIRVDTDDVRAWSLFRIENRFRAAGTYTLTIRRDAEDIKANLILRQVRTNEDAGK